MNPERLRARCAHCGAEEPLSAIAIRNRSLRNLSKSSVAVPIPSEPLLAGITAAVPGPKGRHA